jgi:hypothetical protein
MPEGSPADPDAPHPRAIHMGNLGDDSLIECPHCHKRSRIGRHHNRGPHRHPARSPALTPQKTIRFRGPDGAHLARCVEGTALLQHRCVSDIIVDCVRDHFPPPTPTLGSDQP